MKRFEDKVVLVTGGGTGIGRGVARRFAAEGAEVFLVGLDEEELRESAAFDSKMAYMAGDITKEETLDKVTAEIKSRYGRLDILVNNAGWAPVTPLATVKMEEYDRVFAINVRALVNMTIHVLPLLKESRGNIINMSSAVCENHLLNMSMYAGTKAAVEIFTKIWAKELAKDGVRVNALSIGSIETPIYGKTDLSEGGIQEHIEKVTAMIPQGHFGKPEDVAAVAAFLGSEEARFVTGSIYGVDGGLGA